MVKLTVYGTIYVIKNNTFPFSSEVINAFNEVDKKKANGDYQHN